MVWMASCRCWPIGAGFETFFLWASSSSHSITSSKTLRVSTSVILSKRCNSSRMMWSSGMLRRGGLMQQKFLLSWVNWQKKIMAIEESEWQYLIHLVLRFAITENPPPLSKMAATLKGSYVRNFYVQKKICRDINNSSAYYLLITYCCTCTSWWHQFFFLLENWEWHNYVVAISCHSCTVSTDLHFDRLHCSHPWLTLTSLK